MTPVMNRAIGAMTLFRDATDCMENILNVVKPDASVYTARYVDPEQAATIHCIRVAKDCIRELIAVCMWEGPKILSKMNKSGTAVGRFYLLISWLFSVRRQSSTHQNR
jgi:hypothetical protein